MKKTMIMCGVLLGLTGSVFAQETPFDMTVERPEGAVEQPSAQTGDPDQQTPAATEDRPATVTPGTFEPVVQNQRYLLPFENLMLTGEADTRSWNVYLTPSEAQAVSKINFGYRNAIVVAPETSTIGVMVNDTVVGEDQVNASGGVADRSYDVPAGLLRPGANKITFRALHRHRTDCTIQSTYELWTELVSKNTFFSLDRTGAERLSSIDDIRAIGVDDIGQTRFNVVAPKLEQPTATAPLMRLSQGLAMLASMPNQSFEFTTTLPATTNPGQMTVLVGTSAELASLLPNLPEAAASGSFSAFVNHPVSGHPILTLSGPTWQSVEAAIEAIVAPMNRPAGVQREALMTQRWMGNDAPLLIADTRLPFSRLGMPTSEFTGRRMRTGFDIAVPSDFYADAYGEATILFDAAYSSEVLPGSHIDIYVNGNVASTVPITSPGGGIFRHLPITVTMRHIRPGANRIDIEAVLLTRADEVCAPGTASNDEPRFAMFDTSEFHMPDFARIAQLPNLAAVAGTGFPYGSADRTSLFLDRSDEQTLSAAATFLGKLAVVSGRPVKAASEASALAIGNGNAIFVGAISQIPPLALAQTRLADESRTVWGSTPSAGASQVNTGVVFDEWRSKVSGGSWSGQVTALEEWLKRTFDISLSSLRFAPTEDEASVPPETASLVVAQGSSPSKEGTWTLVTAPTMADLKNGVTTLTQQRNWEQMSGRLTLYKKDDKTIETRPTTGFSFVPTQSFSLANFRLIVANWLSTNILSYAVMLVGFSLLLGVATAMLLGRLGRRG